ncbi:HAMP domain-containing protein [Nonomuraea sp. NPDC059007]|uniref:HAMP domain-containing protein n=1 Tax=Nonomuraea sp. NPDC059007 TaxID=3346692 RepID=UPI00368F6336
MVTSLAPGALQSADLRPLLVALHGLRDGNFRSRLPVPDDPVLAELAVAFNQVVERNEHMSRELNRVRTEVARQGHLDERISPSQGAGSWAGNVTAVNSLIDALVIPAAKATRVLNAVADGDLSQRVDLQEDSRPLRGGLRLMGKAVNRMVDQLALFSGEVTRVAREVGTEGRLGGRAKVQGMQGSWRDVTEAVNAMAGRLTAQVRDIAVVTTAVARGDLTRQVTVEATGELLELKLTVNTMVDQLSAFADEVTRVAREVGTEGRLGGQAQVRGMSGVWKDLTDNVNFMASNLTTQVRSIAQVTTAVANGDLSKKITVDARGEILQLKDTINTMVDQLSAFADEVTRVAREVGTEGQLGGRAEVKGVSGTWKDLTDNVNFMASNLTTQVRSIAQVTTAVAQGDLSRKITVDARGEILQLKDTINTMVDQLSAFASEVTRVAREVGTEGQLGGRADVRGVSGTWKDLTDNVNFMADNLTSQVRSIAQITTAVANGDLSKKITVDARGEILQMKDTINTMVDQLSAFADEVTRVAREVGTEGQLGGRAVVKGVSGVWKDLTDNVNFMASNLTTQVRDIATVATAVAQGDLSRKITVDVKGEILQLKDTVNTMVDQLSAFAAEVTRVAREVGTEGRLGGQAQVRGVSGVWKDLTDNVNFMADNLTTQVRSIAQVATAVAQGDLSRKITVEVKGEILELTNTINTMVDQLSSFADEVTRVAREVGTEGQLGGRAVVKGVSGVWKDLTDNVNFMADNLTSQVRNIAQVTTGIAEGDLSKKITVDARGEILQLKDTINTMVDQLSAFADEVTRVAREVGTEGRLGGQAQVRGVSGVWKDLTDNVNFMASNLTSQVRSIAVVTTAIANGDLSKKITVDARGEILQLKDTINTTVDQLSAFADEVTRVAREVGTEGSLGGQAQVRGVSGVWKDLTDNVNFMASNLTSQVRNIAQVATAVANGDLSKKIDVDARGEILELKTTINTMVDTLSSFSAEVTRVAREVGSEGRLGGQAEVEGVYGTWERLTKNVNELAGNLTTQVRAIAEVASAVAQGDLSRSISLEAKGEVAELKNNVNLMVANLRETTRAKDWLESNLARIAGLMQGHRDLVEVADLILRELTPLVSAQFGAFYLADLDARDGALAFIAGYGAAHDRDVLPDPGTEGPGLIRQAALEKKRILLEDVPADYIKVHTGLGEAAPASVVVLPILFEDKVLGVVELASFSRFSEVHLAFFDQFVVTIGVAINTIIANARTESLLSESQRLAQQLQGRSDELQRQQAELRRSNAALEEKAHLLATSSRYKSEFLANMSHELRTPLNSLLILARLLADNPENNLSAQEVEFASTIHNAGSDLLQLINDILDLSKIEAGRMDVRPENLPLSKVLDYVDATFRPLTVDRGLTFEIEVHPGVPREMFNDERRLQQILRNLLSNAVKFTSSGEVRLAVSNAGAFASEGGDGPTRPGDVIAFAVSDTGIGIAADKLPAIFGAFQQADGTTSRKYGGTGLGLSISSEIARLLGGQIHAVSEPGRGSTFTLFVPAVCPATSVTVESGGAEPAALEPAWLPTEPLRKAVDTRAAPPQAEWPVVDSGDELWQSAAQLSALVDGPVGAAFAGKRVLIVDDDIRNVYALTHVLGRLGMEVIYAENGREGIEALEREEKIALVLMDVMMPEMDGYETLGVVRQMPRFTDLPIIALTAKAMPGDREKTIACGASGYVPKPVDLDHLLEVMRGWLDGERAAEAEESTE